MTLTPSRQLQTGLAGSLVVHGVLLALLVLGMGFNAKWRPHLRPEVAAKAVEKEVVLLFPTQVVPPPPPKPQAQPKAFIRTAQNEATPKAPAKPNFESDRNTVAASEKAPAPDATLAVPTMDGLKRPSVDIGLANQEHQEGKTNDSTAPKALAVPQMLTPQPTTPEEPVAPPAPALIAKAEPKTSPLAKMMEEMDREAVRLEVNRLPLEIRKPGDLPPADTAATPTPPPATRKAIIPDAISPRKKQGNAEGSSSLTRTTEIKGTISNRGQNAVDAERTPQGIYKSAVQAALAQRWHKYHRLTRDAVTFGSLKVEFYVNREGEVQDLKIVSNPQDADARMTDFTLRAIRDAEIPPIPEEVLPLLDDERMKVEYEIIIYP